MFENLFAQGGLSLERLRSFIEVAEAGSIARVAVGDPSRQSLISRQIGELEAFFGVELTRRKGKGLEITEAGRELARQVRLQFQSLADFKAARAGQPVEYRIASGNSILEWLVAPQMGPLFRAASGTFALLDRRTSDIVASLLDHTVDFGILRKSARVPPLQFHALGTLTYALFVPKTLGTKDEHSLPLAISVGREFLEAFEQATARMPVKPHIAFRCTSFTLAAQLARSGTAAAVLPRIAAPFLKETTVMRHPSWIRSLKRELGLAWHRHMLEIRPGAEVLKDRLIKTLSRGLS